MRTLVTGGAGYIGSVVSEELAGDGHEVVVYDSLYKGHRAVVSADAAFVQGDLLDGHTLPEALEQYRIEFKKREAAPD